MDVSIVCLVFLDDLVRTAVNCLTEKETRADIGRSCLLKFMKTVATSNRAVDCK